MSNKEFQEDVIERLREISGDVYRNAQLLRILMCEQGAGHIFKYVGNISNPGNIEGFTFYRRFSCSCGAVRDFPINEKMPPEFAKIYREWGGRRSGG